MSRKPKGLSKQPSHRGIVIVAKFDADGGGFGFIEPVGDGARVNNVFFSSYATQGALVEVGDEVDFIFSKNATQPERGPRAFRVWIRKRAVENDDREHVTTLHGEFEYEP
jgi:cold shock CspA family protein